MGLTLLVTSSCMPSGNDATRVAQAVPAPSPRQLLRALALDTPGLDGLPDTLRASLAAEDDGAANPQAAPAFLAQAASAEDAARASGCLTAAVYYEARSEPLDGQRAVAQVVLNRVRDRAFPHSVCGVVFQGSNRRTGCQFSFTCDGSMAYRREPGAWARARAVAEAALAGSVYAPIGGATFYHTSAILPWWASSLARIGSVGAHIFYRWRGAMEGALSFRAAYAGVEPLAAPSEPVAQTAALYRDSGEDGGVTVHRGQLAAIVRPDPPAGTAIAVAAPRMTVTAGVRVHLGSVAPTRVVTEGATVGEESDPG